MGSDDGFGALRLDADGNAFMLAFSSSTSAPNPRRRAISVVRVDRHGVLSASLPFLVSAPEADLNNAIRFASSSLSPEGILRVLVSFTIPITVGGATIDPLPHPPLTLPDSKTLPQPSLTILTVNAEKGTLASYSAPAVIDGADFFSSIHDGGSYVLATAETAIVLPPDKTGQPRLENRRVLRLE
jgi:hypothetical protein